VCEVGRKFAATGYDVSIMRSVPLRQHATFVLKRAVSLYDLTAGTSGVVVHVYGAGQAYEVELFDETGLTLDVRTITASEFDLWDIEVKCGPSDAVNKVRDFINSRTAQISKINLKTLIGEGRE